MHSTPAIWLWSKGLYLVEVYCHEHYQKLKRMKLKPGPSYGVNHYRQQFFVPVDDRRKVCKALGIKVEKNPNRVAAGKQAAKTHPIFRGQQ